jgi:hypothetical protein
MITIPSIFLPGIIVLVVWAIQSSLNSLFKNPVVDEISKKIAKWTTWCCLVIYFFMMVIWITNHVQFK